MRILGIDAIFHDPAAALVVDGKVVAAAEEERFSRLSPATPVPAAVLFDRDGTLVHDVPYNSDPANVRPVPGARAALDRLRALGVPIGVVSNQSGVARGLVSLEQLDRVNARVEKLLGPFDVWRVCVHGEDDGCGCRKPAPGLVHGAAERLGVPAARCVVIGDIGADVTAAAAAGARGILVPTPRTRRAEVRAAPEVAPDLTAAVALALSGAAHPTAFWMQNAAIRACISAVCIQNAGWWGTAP